LVCFKRFAQGVAEGLVHKNCSRWPDFLRILPHKGDADGRYAGGFNGALNQSHGLIADPSPRGQQHGVNAIARNHGGHFRGLFFRQIMDVAVHDMAHEAVVFFCNPPDDTGVGHFG